MNKKVIFLVLIALGICFGCAVNKPPGDVGYGPDKKAIAVDACGEGLVFDPNNIDTSALPNMCDLPKPAELREKKARLYTGIIKNKTPYDLSVPAGNSGATLNIPAKGWIEYKAWTRKFDLTAYYDGKPYYCLKIISNPKNYPFMCKNYDFIAEIQQPDPPVKTKLKKRKMKRRVS